MWVRGEGGWRARGPVQQCAWRLLVDSVSVWPLAPSSARCCLVARRCRHPWGPLSIAGARGPLSACALHCSVVVIVARGSDLVAAAHRVPSPRDARQDAATTAEPVLPPRGGGTEVERPGAMRQQHVRWRCRPPRRSPAGQQLAHRRRRPPRGGPAARQHVRRRWPPPGVGASCPRSARWRWPTPPGGAERRQRDRPRARAAWRHRQHSRYPVPRVASPRPPVVLPSSRLRPPRC